MKIMDIVDSVIESTLFEMAFQRKVIINKLRDFQFQINRHAMVASLGWWKFEGGVIS